MICAVVDVSRVKLHRTLKQRWLISVFWINEVIAVRKFGELHAGIVLRIIQTVAAVDKDIIDRINPGGVCRCAGFYHHVHVYLMAADGTICSHKKIVGAKEIKSFFL